MAPITPAIRALRDLEGSEELPQYARRAIGSAIDLLECFRDLDDGPHAVPEPKAFTGPQAVA